MNAKKFAGKFIVIDGPDGCGKSTQCELLAEWLKKQSTEVEIYRDPGGTEIGEKIRHILLNPEHIAMSTASEVMLYMAARAQLWAEKISPALSEDKCVLVDRWLSSTCAYQGRSGGFGTDNVIRLATDCLERPWPDLTIILDVDVETGFGRLGRQLDRMEQKGSSYHQKVREGFLSLAEMYDNFSVIDAAGDIEKVHRKIIEAIRKI